jgi:hypothetical protein
LVHSSWTVDYFQFIYFPWSLIVQSSCESLFWWQIYRHAARVGTENLMWQCESYKALDQLGVELCVALFLTVTFWSGTGLENYATLLFCFFYNTIFLNLVNFSVWSWQIKAECLCSGIKLAMWIYIWTSLHTRFSIILCKRLNEIIQLVVLYYFYFRALFIRHTNWIVNILFCSMVWQNNILHSIEARVWFGDL